MSFLDKIKKSKKRKNADRGSFEQLLVGDTAVPVFNVFIHTDKETKKQYIELATVDTIEELHYNNVDLTLRTREKDVKINADFVADNRQAADRLYGGYCPRRFPNRRPAGSCRARANVGDG